VSSGGVRFVAIGDSFTEGLGDELPDGSVRGWADLVAAGLATTADGPVHYANLAVRGRLLAPVVGDQLPAALALHPAPTLITLNGGGNDMMRPGCDVDRLVELTEQAVRQCVDAGVRLVLLSGADPTARLPFGSMMHRSGVALTAAVAELAARYDVLFVDAFGDEELRRPEYWSPDRLHLGPAGHRRVAGLVLAALGHPGAAHVVDPGPDEPRRLRTEARYYREHVLPWAMRRVLRRSSGHGRTGKHLDWVEVEAGIPAPDPQR
jgi:lysophospholipase L1-like esterase